MAPTNEFLTYASLGTFAGVVAATSLIAKFLHGLPLFNNISERWLALLLAEAILLGLSFNQGDFSFSAVFLDILNGFVVAASAVGVMEVGTDNGKAIKSVILGRKR